MKTSNIITTGLLCLLTALAVGCSDDPAPAGGDGLLGAPGDTCAAHNACASGICIADTCRNEDGSRPGDGPNNDSGDNSDNSDVNNANNANNGGPNNGDPNNANNGAENNDTNNAGTNNDTSGNNQGNSSNNTNNGGPNNSNNGTNSNNASNNANNSDPNNSDPNNNTPPDPVDCSGITDAAGDFELCASSDSACEAVYRDGAGCEAVCAAAGLTCGAIFEDVADACMADRNRPEISCQEPASHASDYCVCVRSDCAASCGESVCGGDGCGGTCGDCDAGFVCTDGACVEQEMNPDEDCSRYPYSADALLAERAGFGRNATGGDPNNVYRVTNRSNSGSGSLRAALESDEDYWVVFDVEGTITLSGPLGIASNKTVDGRGRDITINGPLVIRRERNIILSDLKLTNTTEGGCGGQDGDVLLLWGAGGDDPGDFEVRDIWIHHVEAFNGADGLIDLRGATNVTLSWVHAHTHKKAFLMWRDADNDPAGGMHVTMHHNFLDRLSLRGPQFIFGKLHFYNNYQFEFYEYGAGGLGGAQLYSEANAYQAREGTFCTSNCGDPNPCGDNDFFVSKKALVYEWAENGAGDVKSVNDWRVLGDEELDTNNEGAVFDPSDFYSYQADVANEALRVRVRDQAGPRTNYCQ